MEHKELDGVAEILTPFLAGELSSSEVLRLTKEDMVRIIRLGVSAMTGGRDEQAVQVFEMAARLDPSAYLPHHYLGMLAERKGQLEHAVAEYERAGELLETVEKPTSGQLEAAQDIAFVIASLLLQLNRADLAFRYLEGLRAMEDDLLPHLRGPLEQLFVAQQGDVS